MFITFLLFFLWSIESVADEFTIDAKTSMAVPKYAGKVEKLRGSVFKIRSDGKEIPLQNGSFIKAGNVISSNKNSYAKIRMSDDTLLTVGPNSQVRVEKFDYQTKFKRDVTLDILQGRIRCYVLKKVAKGFHFDIKSKNAALGVRGTEVLANHLLDQEGGHKTEFALLSGKAVVKDFTSKLDVSIQSGQSAIFYGKKDTQGESYKKRDLEAALLKELRDEKSYDKRHFPALLRPYLSQNSWHEETSDIVGEQEVEDAIEDHSTKDWRENLRRLNQMLQEDLRH